MKYNWDFLLVTVVVIFISDYNFSVSEASHSPRYFGPCHEFVSYETADKNKTIKCRISWYDSYSNPEVKLFKNGKLFRGYSHKHENRTSFLFMFTELSFTANDNGSLLQCRTDYKMDGKDHVLSKNIMVRLYNNIADIPPERKGRNSQVEEYCASDISEFPTTTTIGDIDTTTAISEASHKDKDDNIKNSSIAIAGCSIVFIAIVLFVARKTYKYKKSRNSPYKSKLHPDIRKRFFKGEFKKEKRKGFADDDVMQIIVPFTNGPYLKKYEIHRNNLEITSEILGSGNFGVVFRGYLTTENRIEVAIKTTREDATNRDNPDSIPEYERAFELFLREIKILQGIGHHMNVVKYIGSVTKNIKNYEAYLIVECCLKENLEKYLRQNKSKFLRPVEEIIPVHYSRFEMLVNAEVDASLPNADNTNRNSVNETYTHNQLLQYAVDIASGMEYLSSKLFVHCDLATRNILLSDTGNRLVAKINDFGLSKHLAIKEGRHLDASYYTLSQNSVIPALWTAPEVMSTAKVSVSSDIWSFGVTMWEIFSLGETPFINEERSGDANTIKVLLLQGVTLENVGKPECATEDEYLIMKNCWRFNAQDRPRFAELHEQLRFLLHRELENAYEDLQDIT